MQKNDIGWVPNAPDASTGNCAYMISERGSYKDLYIDNWWYCDDIYKDGFKLYALCESNYGKLFAHRSVDNTAFSYSINLNV